MLEQLNGAMPIINAEHSLQYREIKVVQSNAYLIDIILSELQCGCRTRLLSYSDIQLSTEIAESLLAKVINKQQRQNVEATVTPSYEAFSPYYRGNPFHTQCIIRRGAKSWYVSNFARVKANRAGSCKVDIDVKSLVKKQSSIFEFVTKNLRSDYVAK